MSHVEPVREELVVNILNRLLQGDNMPFSGNVFLDSVLFSRRSASFERMSGLARCCQRNILEKMPLAFAQMFREILRGPFERRPYVVLKYR